MEPTDTASWVPPIISSRREPRPKPVQSPEVSVAQIEEAIGGELPGDYRNWILSADREYPVPAILTIPSRKPPATEITCLYQPESAAFTIMDEMVLRRSGECEFPKDMLPIGQNKDGDHFLLSLRRSGFGNICFMDHKTADPAKDDWAGLHVLAETFGEWLAVLGQAPTPRHVPPRWFWYRLKHRIGQILDRMDWWLRHERVQPLDDVYLRVATSHVFEGIRIVALMISPKDRDLFVQRTCGALELIKQHDPRRFRRIQREIRFIVHRADLASLGQYDRYSRVCRVNLRNLDFDAHPVWSLRVYCCLLIHEATHGMFDSRGVFYRGHQWHEIERLCHKEEERFARRAWPDSWHEVVAKFDITAWNNLHSLSEEEKATGGWALLRKSYEEYEKSQQKNARPSQST